MSGGMQFTPFKSTIIITKVAIKIEPYLVYYFPQSFFLYTNIILFVAFYSIARTSSLDWKI